MKTARLARLVVAFLFIVAATLQVGQVQLAQAAGSPVVSVSVSAAEQAAAQAFWTPAAMANARALPMPVDTTGNPPTRSNGAPAVSGPAGFGAPGAADPSALSAIQAAYPAAWAASASAGATPALGSASPADGTPMVFDSYYVNLALANQKVYPNVWVGRLYISGTPGSGYCSATAINTNMIVTAAHCVYSIGQGFYSRWLFVPGYRNGNAPFGTFAATDCAVLTVWTTLGSYSISGATPYDVAVCTMGKDSAKKTLNQAVGWAGYQYGYGSDFDMHDLGYPWEDTNSNALPNAGAYLRLCTAESFQAYSGVLGMGCNLGPGISGGSWIVGYQPNVVTGWIDSVNSGYYPGYPDMFGIQFEADNFLTVCTFLHGC
ncbi:MAG: trypsin-like serine protease [Anaerolineales bacterium]